MLDKIKAYWQKFLEVALIIMAGAFLIERNRRKVDEALIDNEKTLAKVDQDKEKIADNTGQIQSIEQHREEIQKEATDAKSSDTDATDFLNRR